MQCMALLSLSLVEPCKMDWFCKWKGDLVVDGNVQDLERDLSQGFGFSISNGSYCPGHGTAAWIIEDAISTIG